MNRLLPYIEVILATCIWGFSFLAIPWVFESMGPAWLTCIRFLISVACIDLFFRAIRKPLKYSRADFLAVFTPGLLLSAYLILQSSGLRFTTPSKSAFITVLYIVYIPFFDRIFFGHKIRPILFLWILFALIGSALICNLRFEEFNFGDFLTLLCGIVCAAHIININRVLKRVPSPLYFHLYQCVWAFFIAGIAACFLEGFSFVHSQWTTRGIVSLMFMGTFPTVFAFLFQIRAQKKIAPSSLGLLLLLESPWAMLFSYLILKEELTSYQLLGAAFILAAAIGGTLSLMRKQL